MTDPYNLPMTLSEVVALNSHMSAWDVAALLGTLVQMIEATYGHHSPEFQAAAAGLGRRR